MNIPINNLYRWIQGLVPNSVVSHFYPHGSKNLENVILLNSRTNDWISWADSIMVICHDQEPLSWSNLDLPIEKIKNFFDKRHGWGPVNFEDSVYEEIRKLNLASLMIGNAHDRGILVHSEKRSAELEKFTKHFVPVYYWCHALLARDWFRFAQHDPAWEKIQTSYIYDFNLYSRAWSGSREYRLKLLENIVSNSLQSHCRTTFCSIDQDQHYLNHTYINSEFKVSTRLPFPDELIPSTVSAEYDHDHYINCAFDVVLETLFDDGRLHLTEKTLRPIACGKPFLLASTHGSLEYLRSYGFETFSPWIDETYDTIEKPLDRLNALTQEMKRISLLSDIEKKYITRRCHEVAKKNQQRFFSEDFFNLIIQELKDGLQASEHLITTTYKKGFFFEFLTRITDLDTEKRYFENCGADSDLVNRYRMQLGLRQR